MLKKNLKDGFLLVQPKILNQKLNNRKEISHVFIKLTFVKIMTLSNN